MKIVIIGDGKFGYELARRLCEEEHSVVIVDCDAKRINSSMNTQDVSCVVGDGIDLEVQKKAGVQYADLVIASTGADETNIICCLIAKKLGAKKTVARLRQPKLIESIATIRDDLGISLTVNPEQIAAREASRILRLPSAAKVDFFAKGKVEIVACDIEKGSPLCGLKLLEIPTKFNIKLLICSVERDNKVYIPDGNFVLREGDQISIISTPSNIVRLFKLLEIPTEQVKSVMIAGGGKTAYYLANALGDMNMKIKIIEQDPKRCDELSELFPKAMIICGDGTDEELLIEEGIAHTDAFVAALTLDEENVVVSMYALASGAKKVITKINHISFGSVLDKAGIECVVTPHEVAATNVLRYTRAMQNLRGSNVETLSTINDGRVEALEFIVRDSFEGLGVPLKELKLRHGMLVACIIRGTDLIFPNGADRIHLGDHVIIVTTENALDDLNDILGG